MTTEDSNPTIEIAKASADELLATRLFMGETAATIERILASCLTIHLRKDHALFEPGERNASLYVVLSGRLGVKLSRASDELLDYVCEGSCVGEMSVLEGQPVSAFVYAVEDSRLLVINDAIVWSLINNSNVVARNLLLLLSARVRSGNKNVNDTIEAKRIVELDAKIDALTGLYNRRWLNDALPRWTKRKDKLSLMILDIDHFKKYNDTHGHLGGDAALKRVASTLMQTLRPVDLAARYGGEEFVVLLPDASIKEAHEIAERVRHSVRLQDIVETTGQVLCRVTVSIGIAELDESLDHIGLLSKADAALYRAKNSGRDQVSV